MLSLIPISMCIRDSHETTEAAMAAEYVDVLQIPAFLCRQTDLLVAAAETGKIVNIKKGQFLSPGAMQFAVQKVVDAGNDNVCLLYTSKLESYNERNNWVAVKVLKG